MGDTSIVQQSIEDALLGLCDLEGGPGHVSVPRGYAHLGLSIIDSIYSLRAVYESHVIPAIDAYCAAVPELRPATARFDESLRDHGATELLAATDGKNEEQLMTLLGGNRQVAPGTLTRKAVVVREVARAFCGAGVGSRVELERDWETGAAKLAVTSVKGVGPAAWRYILLLSGIERVKPDTMITRWVRRVAGDQSIAPAAAGELLEHAAASLGPDVLTIRAADHLVWRYESGRLG